MQLIRNALLAALATFALGAAPAAAYTVTVTSPQRGQTFTMTQPTFTGNVQYDPSFESAPNAVQVEVSSATTNTNYDQKQQAMLSPNGDWSTNGFTLAEDQYNVQACVTDPPPVANDCSDVIPFSVNKRSSIKLGSVGGSALALVQGKLQVSAQCNGSGDDCRDLFCTMTTPPKAARALGVLAWSKGRPVVIARGPVHGGTAVFKSGNARGQNDPIAGGLQFPLFKRLPVTVDCSSAGARASASGSLAWPKLSDHHGHGDGRGDGPVIKRIMGPRKVSLRKRYVDFKMFYGALPGSRFFSAAFAMPGDFVRPGCNNAACTRDHRFPQGGGVLRLHVPLAAFKNRAGFRKAKQVAPLKGYLGIGFLNKKTGHSENARYFVTFVK